MDRDNFHMGFLHVGGAWEGLAQGLTVTTADHHLVGRWEGGLAATGKKNFIVPSA
jgi:hypothetical protein